MKKLKRIVSGFMAIAMVAGTASSSVFASTDAVNLQNNNYSSYIQGDIDGDGDVDNADSAYLANFLKGYKGSANDQMSQRLDVDLSGFIDNLDKRLLSDIIVHNASSRTIDYETSNAGIPPQSLVYYRKYNAQTGTKIGATYPIAPVNNISTNSLDVPDDLAERSMILNYSNKGIVGITFEINDQYFTGSGFVVGSNKILTAAHCVFDTNTDTPARNVTIDVYENSNHEPNTYSALRYHIPQTYYDLAEYESGCGYNCDYAIIEVDHTFPSSYFMDLAVARDTLNNNQSSTVYQNTYDDNRIPRLCIFITGRHSSAMWTEYGCLKFVNNHIITENAFFYSHFGHSGQSGAPVYVETEDDEKTIFGIVSGGGDDFGVGKRIDTNILHFVYNNSNLT